MRQFGLTSELLLLKGQESWWVNCLQIPSKTIHRILTLSGARFYNLRQPSHAWWSPLFKGMWLGFPNGIGQNPHLCSFMGNSRSRGSPSLSLLWDTAACLLVSSELDARPLECACSPLGRKPLGSRAVRVPYLQSGSFPSHNPDSCSFSKEESLFWPFDMCTVTYDSS